MADLSRAVDFVLQHDIDISRSEVGRAVGTSTSLILSWNEEMIKWELAKSNSLSLNEGIARRSGGSVGR